MGATIWLLGCIPAPAQPPGPPPRLRGPEYALAPRLERGLELVYRGTFRERSSADGVRHDRTYRVEARFLVLDTSASLDYHNQLAASQLLLGIETGDAAYRLEHLREFLNRNF